jgi:uncharacterized membrane protein
MDSTDLPEPSSDDGRAADVPPPLSPNVSQNIENIVAFHDRELSRISSWQRRLESFSRLMARPLYLIVLLSVVSAWILGNLFGPRLDLLPFDPPPFALLQGLLTLAALLTTTILLISEHRQAKVETQRSHLDLQVNLLTEQKVTKLIHLLEELRRDLPMVADRHDAEVATLQTPTDTKQVLSALKNLGADHGRKLPDDGAP